MRRHVGSGKKVIYFFYQKNFKTKLNEKRGKRRGKWGRNDGKTYIVVVNHLQFSPRPQVFPLLAGLRRKPSY